MGRRALPKLNPAIEFEHLIRHVRDLPDGFSIDDFFGRAAPLEIEIGSGKGLFIANAARANPETNFLGNEIRVKYARYCAYQAAKAGCGNARIIAGDGLHLVREFVADASVRAVHIYFPDPWWKERHRRRRVINPAFVADLQRILEPGGSFHFWTDVEEYFESAIEQLADESDLSPPESVQPALAEHDMDYRTHFERRMVKNDHPVFRARFSKSPESAGVDSRSSEES